MGQHAVSLSVCVPCGAVLAVACCSCKWNFSSISLFSHQWFWFQPQLQQLTTEQVTCCCLLTVVWLCVCVSLAIKATRNCCQLQMILMLYRMHNNTVAKHTRRGRKNSRANSSIHIGELVVCGGPFHWAVCCEAQVFDWLSLERGMETAIKNDWIALQFVGMLATRSGRSLCAEISATPPGGCRAVPISFSWDTLRIRHVSQLRNELDLSSRQTATTWKTREKRK